MIHTMNHYKYHAKVSCSLEGGSCETHDITIYARNERHAEKIAEITAESLYGKAAWRAHDILAAKGVRP